MAEKRFAFPCDCGTEHIITRGEKGEIVHQKIPKQKPKEEEEDSGEEGKNKKKRSEWDSFFDGLDT